MDAKLSKRDRLLEKQRQLAAELAKLTAREQAEQRKLDTRRKILIGGAVLESLRRGEYDRAKLTALLDKALVHDRDRALFEFLPGRDPEPAKVAPSPAPAPSAPERTATLPLEPVAPASEPRTLVGR